MTDRVGQQLGNYQFTRLLGSGSYADVYLGKHLYLKTEAAIKVLRARLADSDVEEFLNEALTVAHLEHPHIIRILDFNVYENTPFLVMEYAPNGTLRQRYPKGKPVPLPEIVMYVKQIASALQYAHDRKLIHRDVKPENMLLGRRNGVLLSDFGIVQAVQSTLLDKTQPIAGTLSYMAPEQFHGKPRIASDQYALGVVTYEWLCGERPFQGTLGELASQQLFTPPAPLCEKVPAIPLAVEAAVMTALNKDPKQRFANVLDFANFLEQAASSSSFTLSAAAHAPSALLSSMVPPAINVISQPEQMQGQSPLTPIPSMSSTGLTSTDKLAHQQQPLTPPVPSIIPTSLDESAQHQQPPPPPPATQLAQPLYHPIGTDPSQLGRRKHNTRRNLLFVALAIILIISTLTTYFVFLKKQPSAASTPANGIGVSRAADGEYIGISNGSFAFDTNRPDGTLKSQAADKFKAGKISQAETLWQAAIKQETNDAEALIYLEDQRVLASGHPYITLVIGTFLTGNLVKIGRDNLQGAYVTQKEYNDTLKLPGKVQLRLLIANSGNEAAYVTPVAQQIVQAAQVDKTIIGVMGWPFSGTANDAIKVLEMAHIPMISPTANADSLTGISPYFFRVAPSYKRQVFASVRYAEQRLYAKKAALFVDPGETYSKDLAFDFQQQFIADGNSIVATEHYTVGHPQTLGRQLQDALHANPDVIYFSGYANDAVTLLMNLPISGPFANLQVIGGDALSGNGSYPRIASNGFNRLHFSESVAFKEWEALGLAAKIPVFFTEYTQSFDPNKQHTGNPRGFSRADDTNILSYDAILAFLGGSSMVLSKGTKHLSPGDLQQGLTKIVGSQAIQGVSGQISFGPGGDPINKAVVILKLNARGDFTIETVYGNLLRGP